MFCTIQTNSSVDFIASSVAYHASSLPCPPVSMVEWVYRHAGSVHQTTKGHRLSKGSSFILSHEMTYFQFCIPFERCYHTDGVICPGHVPYICQVSSILCTVAHSMIYVQWYSLLYKLLTTLPGLKWTHLDNNKPFQLMNNKTMKIKLYAMNLLHHNHNDSISLCY